VITEIFNNILDPDHFPGSWRVAAIVPVFKKGDRSTPGNYRGISLQSNLANMFTSVLDKRLLDWSSKNNIVSDAQYGFKPGDGTCNICIKRFHIQDFEISETSVLLFY
jgi:hypothetical protein